MFMSADASDMAPCMHAMADIMFVSADVSDMGHVGRAHPTDTAFWCAPPALHHPGCGKLRTVIVGAGVIAGLEVMRIINEPTAAAIAYGLDKKVRGGPQTLLALAG